MKKLVAIAVLGIACMVKADIVLETASEVKIAIPKYTMVTETNSVAIKAGAKAVWTTIVIDFAPGATQATYRVTSHLQDPVTKREIPRTRSVDILKTEDVAAASVELGINFLKIGEDIGKIVNKHLEKKYTPAK